MPIGTLRPVGPVVPPNLQDLGQSSILQGILSRLTLSAPSFRAGAPETRNIPFGAAQLIATPAQAAAMGAPGPGDVAGANIGGATGPRIDTSGSAPAPPPSAAPPGIPTPSDRTLASRPPSSILGSMIGVPSGPGIPTTGAPGAPPGPPGAPQGGGGGGRADIGPSGPPGGDPHFAEKGPDDSEESA